MSEHLEKGEGGDIDGLGVVYQASVVLRVKTVKLAKRVPKEQIIFRRGNHEPLQVARLPGRSNRLLPASGSGDPSCSRVVSEGMKSRLNVENPGVEVQARSRCDMAERGRGGFRDVVAG